MKTFRLEAPEGNTICLGCPFNPYNDVVETTKTDICAYLAENNLCEEYDFNKAHIWNDTENN